VWDAGLSAVRAYLRGEGLREVSTPTRVDAVALEPWIEPIASEDKLLVTSPELAMKQLLARGGGSMFQIAHVFRKAERGDRHSEEFHLIEWYRVAGERDPFAAIIGDVEQLVAAVSTAIADVLGRASPRSSITWERRSLLDLMSETLGHALRGDEDAAALAGVLAHVRSRAGLGFSEDVRPPTDPALASLLAWTELFSLWSDAIFDPWQAARGQGRGLHVVGFPAALAALARVDGPIGARFESHVCTSAGPLELANGYRELRDPAEQRRRFELVAAMREHYGQPARPMPEAFITELAGMPECAGVALGLDRLLALACGCTRLEQVSLGLTPLT
jgi:lysyl-tRNA synthetase class 2